MAERANIGLLSQIAVGRGDGHSCLNGNPALCSMFYLHRVWVHTRVCPYGCPVSSTIYEETPQSPLTPPAPLW